MKKLSLSITLLLWNYPYSTGPSQNYWLMMTPSQNREIILYYRRFSLYIVDSSFLSPKQLLLWCHQKVDCSLISLYQPTFHLRASNIYRSMQCIRQDPQRIRVVSGLTKAFLSNSITPTAEKWSTCCKYQRTERKKERNYFARSSTEKTWTARTAAGGGERHTQRKEGRADWMGLSSGLLGS